MKGPLVRGSHAVDWSADLTRHGVQRGGGAHRTARQNSTCRRQDEFRLVTTDYEFKIIFVWDIPGEFVRRRGTSCIKRQPDNFTGHNLVVTTSISWMQDSKPQTRGYMLCLPPGCTVQLLRELSS